MLANYVRDADYWACAPTRALLRPLTPCLGLSGSVVPVCVWARSHLFYLFPALPLVDFLQTEKCIMLHSAVKLSADDTIVYLCQEKSSAKEADFVGSLIERQKKADAAFYSNVSVLPRGEYGCVVFSPVAKLTDYDDVRCFYEAAAKGVKRAFEAGAHEVVVALPNCPRFRLTPLVTILGALKGEYQSLEELDKLFPGARLQPFVRRKVGVWNECADLNVRNLLTLATFLESGRVVARDIGGGDPEKMSPPNVEEYVRRAFEGTCVRVEVVSDEKELTKEYPLFAAVNRAASGVPRHRGRIIYLRYDGDPTIEKKETLVLVGKGITFDTGGVNVKIQGAMTGMSRDKCGAAAVAGFMKVVSLIRPANMRIVGALCLARNSIGENCYVPDEVIVARSKARVRIENTDAEGRMVMADVLCKLKEEVMDLENVHMMTIATLTGHAPLSVGCYSIVMDNSVARARGNARRLQEVGEEVAEPFEISLLRKEDIAFHRGKWPGDDVHQSGGAPSTRTCRGHQGPAGFLVLASGLDRHELSSPNPISYSHLDIAGSAGDPPQAATGAPVVALVFTYLRDSVEPYC